MILPSIHATCPMMGVEFCVNKMRFIYPPALDYAGLKIRACPQEPRSRARRSSPDRVESPFGERVAAQYPPDSHKPAFECPVLFHRLQPIL